MDIVRSASSVLSQGLLHFLKLALLPEFRYSVSEFSLSEYSLRFVRSLYSAFTRLGP